MPILVGIQAFKLGRSDKAGADRADPDRQLSFMEDAKRSVTIWSDGKKPRDVIRTERTLRRSESLVLKLSEGGGGVLRLGPSN